jgi:hypothetical protein
MWLQTHKNAVQNALEKMRNGFPSRERPCAGYIACPFLKEKDLKRKIRQESFCEPLPVCTAVLSLFSSVGQSQDIGKNIQKQHVGESQHICINM